MDLRFAPGPGAGALVDLLYAELDPFEPIAIQEHEAGDGWLVFFRTSDGRGAARRALLSEFRNALDATPVDVDDEDWAKRSQAALKAVRIGRITVAPPWDVPALGAGRSALENLLVVIEPSTGFGTGHHATTRLCLDLLQQVDVVGKSVIDVGTGSGVLAIAAAKLGASHVVGIDNDPDALQNAYENVRSNSISSVVELRETDATTPVDSADVVLANLTAAVLVRIGANLRRMTVPEGVLIVSGFTEEESQEVVEAIGLVELERRVQENWTAVALRGKPGRESSRPGTPAYFAALAVMRTDAACFVVPRS